MSAEVAYEQWIEGVHLRIKKESIWGFYGYRKALYVYELTWGDCDKLTSDVRGKAIVQQLIRSVGSISANLEEGHGRGFGKQRNWFFQVALASARETKGWYWRANHLLDASLLEARLSLLDEIIALLVTELSRQRDH